MSANDDAPGEVNKNKVFYSPNISSSDEEIEEEEDKATEEQKKRETVEVDGVPIEEKDIKFKAEDIKKKKKINYFVNVEGAEERAKAEAKRKEEEKRAAEKQAEDEKKAVERQKKEERIAAHKKLAEDTRKLADIKAYINKQKKQKAHSDKRAESRSSKRGPIIAVGISILVAVAAILVVNLIIIPANQRNAEEFAQRNQKYDYDHLASVIYDLNSDENLNNDIMNYNFDAAYKTYALQASQMKNDTERAHLYIDLAERINTYASDYQEEVISAAEIALVYAPFDPEVDYYLMNLYYVNGDEENAARMERYLQSGLTSQGGDSGSDSNNDESGEK